MPALGTPASGNPAADVTAVLVTRGVTEYLPTTIEALAAQTVPPAQLYVVDAGPDDPARSWQIKEMLGRAFVIAARRPRIELTTAPGRHGHGAANLGSAIRAVLEPAASLSGSWLWLLHDDSAPEPGALAALLATVASGPSIAIAGPKQVSWDPGERRVLEVGVSQTWWGRRVGIDHSELDQGQYDRREDVLGVGTAGMLIRADVWFQLDGPDPVLGPFGDGLDLSKRARLAGHRVVVAPRAVIRHAQAGYHGLRSDVATRDEARAGAATSHEVRSPAVDRVAVPSGVVRDLADDEVPVRGEKSAGSEVGVGEVAGAEPSDTGADGAVLPDAESPDSSVQPTPSAPRKGRKPLSTDAASLGARRLATLHARLVDAPWWAVPFVFLGSIIGGVARALGRLAGQQPGLMPTELLAPFRSLRLGAIARAKRRNRATRTQPRAILRPLRARWTETLPNLRTYFGIGTTGERVALNDLEIAQRSRDRRRRWSGLGVVIAALTVVTVRVFGPVLGHAFGASTAPLHGGSFAGVGTSSLGLWQVASSGWVPGGAGGYGPGDPILFVVSGLGYLVGSPQRALGLMAGATVVLAGLGAWYAAGAATRSAALRLFAALVWAGSPVLVTAVSSATLGPMMAHAVLPWLVLALARAYGVAQRDHYGPVDTTAPFSLAAAATSGILLALLGTASLALFLVVAAVVLVITMFARGKRLLAIATLTLPVALLWPWLLAAIKHPAMLSAAPGVPVNLGAPTTAHLVVGWTGEFTRLGLGFLILFGVVAALAVLALLRRDEAGWAVRGAWVIGAAGLALAAVTSRNGGSGYLTGLSAWWAGLIAAGLLGAHGLAAWLARRSFSWRHAVTAVVLVLGIAVPVAAMGTWLVTGTGFGAAPTPTLPAAATLIQAEPTHPRILLLDGSLTELSASYLWADGPQLPESATARTYAPPATSSDDGHTALATLAATVAAGTVDVADLAQVGIGGVVVAPTADVALAARVEQTPGLEFVTHAEQGTTYRVATPTGFALIHTGTGLEPLTATGPVNASGEVQANQRIVLATAAAPHWEASVDGRRLVPQAYGWQQSFVTGPSAGTVTITYAPGWRPLWLAALWVVAVLTALLALPLRRPRRREDLT